MHRSMQTFVGTHREQVNSYHNNDARNPKTHYFHNRMPDGPMVLSAPGATPMSATVRMFAKHRIQGNAIVTIKCTSDPDNPDNSLLSVYEPNRHTTYPLRHVTLVHVPYQKNKGVPVWESLQILVPLTTEGSSTVGHHALPFQLLPSDVATGLTISVIAASLNNVRITDIATQRAQSESDSICNKLKSFVAKTELSKSTIVLVDSNTMPHDTNSLHVQRESTPTHPMGLLSSPGLKMGGSCGARVYTAGQCCIVCCHPRFGTTPQVFAQCTGARQRQCSVHT